MSAERPLRQIEAGARPRDAVNAWLAEVVAFPDATAYVRACIEEDPVFEPQGWILQSLAEWQARRPRRRTARATFDEERTQARVLYALATDLLDEGERFYDELFLRLELVGHELQAHGDRAASPVEREMRQADRRAARAAAITLIHEVAVQQATRAMIERRYFHRREVAYQRARDMAALTRVGLDVLRMQVEETNTTERVRIPPATDAEVRAAVDRRILEAKLAVVRADGDREAATRYLRELLREDEGART